MATGPEIVARSRLWACLPTLSPERPLPPAPGAERMSPGKRPAMPQAAPSRSRAHIVFLVLSLLALPALADEPGTQTPRDPGLFLSFWQALTDVVPGLEMLGPELDPLGGDEPEPNRSQGDLGPGLDPLG